MSSKKKPRKRPAKRKAPTQPTEFIEAVRLGSGAFHGHPRMDLLCDDGLARFVPVAERMRAAVARAEEACARDFGEIKLGTSIAFTGNAVATRLDAPAKDLDTYLHLYLEGPKGLLGDIAHSDALGRLLAAYTIELVRALGESGGMPVPWLATDFLRNRTGPYAPRYWEPEKLLAGDRDEVESLERAVLKSSVIALGWACADGPLPLPVDVQIYRSVRVPNGPSEIQPSEASAWFGLLCADARSLRVYRHVENLKRRRFGATYSPDRDYPAVSARWIEGHLKQESWLAACKKAMRLLAFRGRREPLEDLIADESFLLGCRLLSLGSRLEDCRRHWLARPEAERDPQVMRAALEWTLGETRRLVAREDDRLNEAVEGLARASGELPDTAGLEEATARFKADTKAVADSLARELIEARPGLLPRSGPGLSS